MKENRKDWRTWEGNRGCKEFWKSVLRSLSQQQEDILVAIGDGSIQPKEIAEALDISQQTASAQLTKLSRLELVDSIQLTREAYYNIKQQPLIEVLVEKKN